MQIKLYIGSELADFNERFNVVFSIGDIRSLSFGSVNRSYTLNIPLTKTNKRLLKFVTQTSVKTEPSALARLYMGEILVISGKLKVMTYNDYYVKAIIESDYWIDDLKEKKMIELDLSASDHILSHSVVDDTWTAVYPVFRYPMIDFGGLQSGESNTLARWFPSDFIPMVSIASLIAKILEPFTISSTWIGTGFVKNLFILCNEYAVNASFLDNKALLVIPQDATFNQNIWDIVAYDRENSIKEHNPVVFNIETTDEGGDFTANIYTVPETGTYRFKFTCKGSLASVADGGNTIHQLDFLYKIYTKVAGAGAAIELASTTINAAIFAKAADTIVVDTGYVHLLANDTVYCYFALDYDIENTTASTKTYTLSLVLDTQFENLWGQSNQLSGTGKTISLEEMLPDMSQLDFLAAIRDIANLRFWLDKARQVVHIEPLDSFVSSSVIDLTEFIDFEDNPGELISTNFSKNIFLRWADDDDKSFEEYYKSNVTPLGEKEITLTSLLTKKEPDYRVHPFSTIHTGINYSIGDYVNSYPRIWNTVPVAPYIMFDRKQGFNTRLVEWKGLTAGLTWYYESVTKSTYPKIQGVTWDVLYSAYWQKHFHYIDKGKIHTFKLKVTPGMLNQFFTVVDTAANEAFRPTYSITLNGNKNYYFMQSFTTDGNVAEIEMILK